MKATTIKRFPVIVIIAILIFSCFLVYLNFQKKIIITGFANDKDIITIKQGKSVLAIIHLEGHRVDSNRIYFFNETLNVATLSGNITLQMEIDSSNHKLLDTMVLITKNKEEPFISFEDPTRTKYIRKFFIGDEAKIVKF